MGLSDWCQISVHWSHSLEMLKRKEHVRTDIYIWQSVCCGELWGVGRRLSALIWNPTTMINNEEVRKDTTFGSVFQNISEMWINSSETHQKVTYWPYKMKRNICHVCLCIGCCKIGLLTLLASHCHEFRLTYITLHIAIYTSQFTPSISISD